MGGRRRRRGSRKRRNRRRRRGGDGEQYKFGGVGFVERILRFWRKKAKKRGDKLNCEGIRKKERGK